MTNEKQFTKTESEELSNIVSDLSEKSVKIFQTYLERQQSKPLVHMDQMAHLGDLYQEFMHKLIANPYKLAEAQFSYWKDFLSLWHSSTLTWLGQPAEPVIEPDARDKRFKHVDWEHNPLFNFIKQFYLLTAKHIQSVVNNVDDVDEKTAKKIDFYTRQFIDAMSPTNFVATNPDVLRKTIESKGQNLLNGLDNMLADLEHSEEHLHITMTDLEAFEVGKNLAITPGKVIYQNSIMQLIQYAPKTKQVYKKPLLIVPPWINKYYVLDLSQKNSFVKWVVEQGYTVFVISWVNPDHRHAKIDFQDYLRNGTLAALDAIEKSIGVKEVNALGFCIGGTLLASTLAYLAYKKQPRITSATYLATLLDFRDPGDMGVLIDDNQIRLLEHDMHKKGYLDGGRMSFSFNLLRANDLVWSYFIKNYLQGEEPFPYDLLFWNSDATNMPARMHSFYLRGMYLDNLLTKPNSFKLANVPIDLRRIETPIYFLSTHHDHIAPWESTYAGISLHSGPTKFVLGGSGHIAGVINPPVKKKYHYWTNSKITKDPEKWLSNAKDHEGSWWPDWEKWLRKHSGSKVTARNPEKGKLPVVEDAPGSYVKVRLRKRANDKVVR